MNYTDRVNTSHTRNNIPSMNVSNKGISAVPFSWIGNFCAAIYAAGHSLVKRTITWIKELKGTPEKVNTAVQNKIGETVASPHKAETPEPSRLSETDNQPIENEDSMQIHDRIMKAWATRSNSNASDVDTQAARDFETGTTAGELPPELSDDDLRYKEDTKAKPVNQSQRHSAHVPKEAQARMNEEVEEQALDSLLNLAKENKLRYEMDPRVNLASEIKAIVEYREGIRELYQELSDPNLYCYMEDDINAIHQDIKYCKDKIAELFAQLRNSEPKPPQKKERTVSFKADVESQIGSYQSYKGVPLRH